MEKQWTTYWSRSQRGLGMSEKKCQKHQRFVLKTIPSSSQIKLKFAAYYDIDDILIKNVYIIDGKIKRKATFLYQETYLLNPGRDIYTDEIDITSQNIIIEYDIETRSPYTCQSGMSMYDYDCFIEGGYPIIYALCGIDLYTHELNGCICVFGDSIVEQGHYTRILKEKYASLGYSVINLGVSSNRLLRQIEYLNGNTNIPMHMQWFGIAAIERYATEVLSCQNIKRIIIAIGINDLYQPGSYCAAVHELPTLQEMYKGYQSLYHMTSCIPITFLSLTPFHARNELRVEVNQWLLQHFQHTIDFDDIFMNHGQLVSDVYQPDYLHPNELGGHMMAQKILKNT